MPFQANCFCFMLRYKWFCFLLIYLFIFRSGLLVAYLGFRRMDQNDGQLPLAQFYFHRFWRYFKCCKHALIAIYKIPFNDECFLFCRLTPTYMFVILFYSNLFAFLGDGPVWFGNQLRTPCDQYWWTNLLYINNFHPNQLTKEVRTTFVMRRSLDYRHLATPVLHSYLPLSWNWFPSLSCTYIYLDGSIPPLFRPVSNRVS